MNYIDMHCDTLSIGLAGGKDITRIENACIDFDKLRKGGAKAQFFAAFLAKPEHAAFYGYEELPDHFTLLETMRKRLFDSLENAPDFAFASNADELKRNFDAGKISAMLSLENAELVDGKPENINRLKDLGISLMSFTWNDENCFGYPNSTDPDVMSKGLKTFAIESIPLINDLGIVIDVSHLNDGGFYDVAKYSKKPFVASHSNCRELSPHPRNLTDDMIRTLAECGGVAGVNFYGCFLYKDTKMRHTSLPLICDHILHMIKVGGIECVGIGTDFDGFDDSTYDIKDTSEMHLLFDELKTRGLSYDDIEKIAFRNVERVLN